MSLKNYTLDTNFLSAAGFEVDEQGNIRADGAIIATPLENDLTAALCGLDAALHSRFTAIEAKLVALTTRHDNLVREMDEQDAEDFKRFTAIEANYEAHLANHTTRFKLVPEVPHAAI